ncbi:MAG TPA: EEP domain-containing protein, partial [Nevskia sp.]|nr:EEP domain-containing protein [Nevskia sp.]
RLEEAFVRLSGRAARSFPARLPLLRLDRVYCRNLVPLRLYVLSRRPWSHLSDHAALCVEGLL